MFVGIEAPRVALEPLGWKCVWENEIDKNCCKLLRKHYGENTLVEGDIRNVDAKNIPNHTLLIAGFPCQPFSLAGKRKGITEDRGTLFTHIARVASIKRPKYLLLENVKGLLSSSNGRDFAIILRTLGNLGYILEWQVLNSKCFGVAQSRERVFIIGHLGEKPIRRVFPLYDSKQNANDRRCEEKWQIAPTLSTKQDRGSPMLIEEEPRAILTPSRDDKRQNGRRTKEGNEPMFTLTAIDRHGIMTTKHPSIRFLTPNECEALQGFPKDYTKGFTKEIRYKMLGNSMTTNVIKWLGIQIMSLLSPSDLFISSVENNKEVKA